MAEDFDAVENRSGYEGVATPPGSCDLCGAKLACLACASSGRAGLRAKTDKHRR